MLLARFCAVGALPTVERERGALDDEVAQAAQGGGAAWRSVPRGAPTETERYLVNTMMRPVAFTEGLHVTPERNKLHRVSSVSLGRALYMPYPVSVRVTRPAMTLNVHGTGSG